MSEIRSLENKIFDKFEQEVVYRREMERKMLSQIEEKSVGLRQEIAKESKNRFESIEHLKACLEVCFCGVIVVQNDLPKLQEGIKTESSEREEMDL